VAASAVPADGPALNESTPAGVAETLAHLESGVRYLFDNAPDTLDKWLFVGARNFAVRDGALQGKTRGTNPVLRWRNLGDFDRVWSVCWIGSTVTPASSRAHAIG
jgi:hypothetical protein